jgi:carboxypeptidase C (cathepsin A)
MRQIADPGRRNAWCGFSVILASLLAASGYEVVAAQTVATQGPATAGRTSPQSPGAVLQGDGTVLSRHTVRLADGRQLSYTARVGFLPLRRDDAGSNGELLGEMFFVAYTADTQQGEPVRPLTFVWGGGPGGAASLSGMGPRELKGTNDYENPPPPYEMVDNPDTWLDITDLVLIDEMGTGYSRMAKPEYRDLYFSRDADAESFTEFMRIYLRRYDTTNAPIFLRGGSYGSIRSALVSAVAERRGIPISGMTLSALAILDPGEGSISRFPAFTVAAMHHGKLAPELLAEPERTLREAEAFASGPYATALGRGSAMPAEERQTIIQQYARYTGLTPELIERDNLRISTNTFGNELLRSEGRIVGHYDSRITEVSAPREFNPTTDPSLNARGNAMPRLQERIYLSRELGANADLLGPRVDGVYLGPFGGTWPPVRADVFPRSVAQSAEWMAMRWTGGITEGGIMQTFAGTMESNDRLHVLMVTGKYDLVTPYFGMEAIRAAVRSDARDRIRIVATESGHSVPDEQVHEAARAFYRDVLAGRRSPARR